MSTTLAEPVHPSDSLPRSVLPPRITRPDRRGWHDGPTPVSLADLSALTRDVAAEVVAGRHEAHVDPVHRWSQRLYADEYLDVWLIGWATEQATELHDHGGSIGALTVVSGELTEWRWTAGDRTARTARAEERAARGPGLRQRPLDAGRGAAFPVGYVHDVCNHSAGAAVSVHAYSPALSTMSYYEVARGDLRRTRSELVAPGEPPE